MGSSSDGRRDYTLISTTLGPTNGVQFTADEAKAMLMKAVAAVKADKAKALDMFNKGEGGFLDRDLYVFCANVSDGWRRHARAPLATSRAAFALGMKL